MKALSAILAMAAAALAGGTRPALPLRRRRKRASGGGGMTLARIRSEMRIRALERYGCDISGSDAEVADARRRLRNARKQERRAA